MLRVSLGRLVGRRVGDARRTCSKAFCFHRFKAYTSQRRGDMGQYLQDGCGSEEEDPLYIHCMGYQKHIVRGLAEEGVTRVGKTEETPWTGGDGSNAVCLVHKSSGCGCGAAWKCIPRSFLAMVGGKVAMEKLFRTHGISHIYPKTFINIAEYRAGHETETTAEGDPAKWFVKVSHMNSRKMMICSSDPDEIEEHVATFPATYKYVIQKEVEKPLLIDGFKTLLRLWVIVTKHPDGSMYYHYSRRLRLNKLQAKYDETESSSEADLCHQTVSIYRSTTMWPLYQPMWTKCVEIAEKILKTVMKKWTAYPQGLLTPPENGGLYNIFAIDYVPTAEGPVLIEANVDPGFKNKCSETKLAAEDLISFFFLPILTTGAFTLPDPNFLSVSIDPPALPAKPAQCPTLPEDEECPNTP